ncbi:MULTISPECIES: PDR/VanB family oxidoreductase [unclassified Xanthobacter]|uniref:PDR/VanB family oxidoreductase n=1 Tax=unclassified Xanthobacter TaxID=2623496 RepID=UPI001F16BAFD|nr:MULTISPECIES: PDR/VanB family oxidoreductase [unclassified Xanthobacter]
MSDDALHPVVVAKKTVEANNMVSLELVDPAGAELPGFTPGSHIDVTIPGGLVRQYSLFNSADERNHYLIGVWKDANSRGGSLAMYENVNVGDTLQVSAPRNRFAVPKGTARAVLMARGIGITPILSIADHLKKKEVPFELHYVFAGGSPGSFQGTIEASAFAENTTFYLEGAQPPFNPANILADRPDDTELFLCGVDWWMDPIAKTAQQKGFGVNRIHMERFGGKAPAPLLDKVFSVKIASTGKTYEIPGDKSVSGALEERGVKIRTSCEQGACGTCKVKVLEGEVDHRDKRLSAAERDEGWMLACVSRGKGDLLVLDL